MRELPAYQYEDLSDWFNYVARMNKASAFFEITVCLVGISVNGPAEENDYIWIVKNLTERE